MAVMIMATTTAKADGDGGGVGNGVGGGGGGGGGGGDDDVVEALEQLEQQLLREMQDTRKTKTAEAVAP